MGRLARGAAVLLAASAGSGPVAVATVRLTHRSGRASERLTSAPRPRWSALGPYRTRGFPDPPSRTSPAVSGRVNAIVAQESTCAGGACRVLYVGSAEGGVWKTVDRGRTWRALTDTQGSLATGALALDQAHPRQLYVGTGESLPFGNAIRGVGVLHSGDGGASWETLGARAMRGRAVTGLIVDPRTTSAARPTLYATTAVAGAPGSTTDYWDTPLPPGTAAAGFLRSTDGGRSWRLSNPRGIDASAVGADSLAIDPRHAGTLYAGFIQSLSPRGTAVPSGPGARRLGLYRSDDDGRHWRHLSGGGQFPVPDRATHAVLDRTAVAIARSDPRVVYVAFSYGQLGGGESLQLFRSADRGATWARVAAAPNVCGAISLPDGQPEEPGQCFFDMTLTVAPDNPAEVYLGGIGNVPYLGGLSGSPCLRLSRLPVDCQATLARSLDGGRTWADVGSNPSGAPLHGDNHVTYIPASDPHAVYDGDDGGLWHSSDAGRSWRDLNRGLDTLMFYGVAVGATGGIDGGTQDNGELRLTGAGVWRVNPLRDDVGMVVADPSDPHRIYWEAGAGGPVYREDRAPPTAGRSRPATQTQVSPYAMEPALARFPVALAPSRPAMVLAGTDRLWRSLKRGGVDGNGDGDATNDRSDTEDWVPISPHLDRGGAALHLGPGPWVSAIAVSPVDAGVVAFGVGDGRIYLTTQATRPVRTSRSCDSRLDPRNPLRCDFAGGVSWRTIRALPARFVAAVHFAPRSSRILYAVVSNYSSNTPGHPGHLFVSTDRGARWRRIDRGLPDIAFSDLAISPVSGALYASGESRVYVSTDGGRHWARFDGARARAPVNQLAYAPRRGRRERAGHLLAATWGRGLWETPAP